MSADTLGEVIDFGRGFWSEDRRSSGRRIDELRGQNIPTNSKTIDRTLVPKGVVSHKSTDIRRKSYRSPQTVYWVGMRFVRQLLEYEGELRQDHRRKATYYLQWAIEGTDYKRVLEWFVVPPAGVPTAHEQSLRRVIAEASALGITVKLFRVQE